MSAVFLMIGILCSWYFTYDYAKSKIENAKNEGVLEERSRWNDVVLEKEVSKRVIDEAEILCGSKISQLNLESEKSRSKFNETLKDCKNSVDHWKSKTNEALVRPYFNSIFERLKKLEKEARKLGRQKQPGAQSISKLNETARNLLRDMKRGREAFNALATSLNHDASRLLEELEEKDLSVWDLRNRIIPLSNSKKEKRILLEKTLSKLKYKT